MACGAFPLEALWKTSGFGLCRVSKVPHRIYGSLREPRLAEVLSLVENAAWLLLAFRDSGDK